MIKVLTEGSSAFGFGHIVRCSSIIKYCVDNKLDYRFIVDGDESSEKIIAQSNAEMLNWKNKDFIRENIFSEDIVFTDSYHAELPLYNQIKKQANYLFIIDDLKRLPYKDCTVINPNFSASLLDVSDKENCYLYGEKFVLLRDEFVGKKNLILNEEVKRVLVTFGGSDILNLTPKVIAYLKSLDKNIQIDVVVGFGYNSMKEIEKECDEQVKIHHNLSAKEMAELACEVDFAVSAAGQTVNELLKVGCPACFIEVIDNQRLNIEYVQSSARGLVFRQDDFSSIKQMMDRGIRTELKNKISQIKNDSPGVYQVLKALEKDKNNG